MAGLTYLDSVKQMPLLPLPVRAVVVSLGQARILISPGTKLTPEQLTSAGEITDIVAPSLLHAAGVPAAAKLFPRATLWGPRGLHKRFPGLTWKVLGQDAWPYQAELALFPLAGIEKIRESVFVHRDSGTLIVADLVFNLLAARGLGARLILGLFGTWKKLGISKFFLRFQSDAAAFRASLAELTRADFDRIVPSHGEVVESGGKAALVGAMKERGLA
jgi:hypothetical protein